MPNFTKTTIEIDETKLSEVMRLAGFKTRKEAVDWALTEAGRIAGINKIAESPWSAEFLREAVDPNYDILEARSAPVSYRRARR